MADMTEACDVLIRNAYVLTCDAKRTKHPKGAVAVAGRRIAAVGPSAELEARFKAKRTIDANGAVVHPGVIDLHYHITQHMIGKMIEEASLEGEDPLAWIGRQYTGMSNALRPEEEQANAQLGALDMLHNGVTFFVEPGTVHSPDAVAEALTEVGVRGSLADPWMIDVPGPAFEAITAVRPDTQHCVSVLGGQLKRNADPDARVRGHVAIYGVGGQTLDLMRAAKALAEKTGGPFNMHQSQSVDDAEGDTKRFGKNPLVRYAEEGLLSPSCVFVHMNVLREDEIEPVVKSGLSIVWSPTNSWYYGTRRQAPNRIPGLARRGVNVTLGLDVSKAASFGDQAYTAYVLARDQGDYLSPEDLLQMQTLNGARAMKVDSWLGSLEAGKRADIVVRRNDLPEAWPRHNTERQQILLARGKSVGIVMVDGEILIEGGRHAKLDENKIYERADRAAHTLRERAGLA